MPGRRDRLYYALTGKGLDAFINGISSYPASSEEFWSAIIWYCILTPIPVSISDLEKYCTLFEFKYLGHTAINSYLFQSRFFDELVKTWLEENCMSSDNTISLLQKILECMAITGKMTRTNMRNNWGIKRRSKKNS
jgi:hypothetical protein